MIFSLTLDFSDQVQVEEGRFSLALVRPRPSLSEVEEGEVERADL